MEAPEATKIATTVARAENDATWNRSMPRSFPTNDLPRRITKVVRWPTHHPAARQSSIDRPPRPNSLQLLRVGHRQSISSCFQAIPSRTTQEPSRIDLTRPSQGRAWPRSYECLACLPEGLSQWRL